jgi:sigma-B regulation protein RsbU (phosphoserine phosphatase)
VALQNNLPFFGIACVALVVGVSSLLLTRLRSRDRLLLWVGTFSVLYAIRLFLDNDLVRVAMNIQGREFAPWRLCLTYIIPIPYALFARELFGRGWNGAIAVWLWIEVAFAVVAIPTALAAHQDLWTDLINGVLVIGGTLLVLLHVLGRQSSDWFANSLKWPLIAFGILVLLTNRGFRPAGLDVEPVGFLILLAGLGSTAARHALASERKLIDVEQELATARRIQSSIIPQSAPGLTSLRLATRYQPMTSVAGDFYDFIKTSEHGLTILVADVSGHGVPAALVASMLKVCFAAQREQANNPAGVLAGLNTMLRGSLGGQYVTAACAAINVEARVITYAGAGHPPSLLFRRNGGEVVQLSENGLFIGPFPNATYSNILVPFQSGDKLLLYTDGIIEAAGPDGQEFGRERLEHLLHATKDLEPAEFVERLFQEISTPAQQDDLTVVLAQIA